ncbi:MAG: phosphoribosylformylglycinamidine synthase I, partial [Parvularculaceae bacterium]|nr:phosphoribosylformylglycinamidine synthase I [Parvularculaceae bacterium]
KAKGGTPVLGVCNGFQVLTETGLLPGALLRNADLSFVCRPVVLRVENAESRFTRKFSAGQYVTFPVAHHDGNYFADEATLDRLEGEGRVVFRYVDNPNGSARNIAGILNDAGNVMGLMPHPERAISPLLGGVDGVDFFKGFVEAAA